jgi:hypothetical protein
MAKRLWKGLQLMRAPRCRRYDELEMILATDNIIGITISDDIICVEREMSDRRWRERLAHTGSLVTNEECFAYHGKLPSCYIRKPKFTHACCDCDPLSRPMVNGTATPVYGLK